MDRFREKSLRKNFSRMFWIQALTEVKVINVISTLFYVHRGLTLSQIFYLSLAFAITSVLTEVPSSYLADKWSRKGLIIISLIIGVIFWSLNLVSYGFWPLVLANSLYALAYSIMSGTDEALVYDTAKELHQEQTSLKKLGQFYSAQRIFKIVGPLVAVVVAKNLVDWQFQAIIAIDIVANLIGLVLAGQLIEPSHSLDVQKIESNIILSAFRLLKNNQLLFNSILNRTLIFIASFLVWRISSEYLQKISTPLIFIGLAAVVIQSTIFILNLKAHRLFRNHSSEQIINFLNISNLIIGFLFLIHHYFVNYWFFAVILYCLFLISEAVRGPYFSDLFNKYSHSHNRATTLSLSNLLNSLLQIPVFIFGAALIKLGYLPFLTLVVVLVLIANLFFRLTATSDYQNVKIPYENF